MCLSHSICMISTNFNSMKILGRLVLGDTQWREPHRGTLIHPRISVPGPLALSGPEATPSGGLCLAKEISFLPVVDRFISTFLQSSYPTYLNSGFNFQVNRQKGSNNNNEIRGCLRLHKIITLDAMADQSKTFGCSLRRQLRPFPSVFSSREAKG